MAKTRSPRHIAFIMDGNRRFAKRLMKDPTKGHDYGAKKIRRVYEWCKKAGARELTFYAFSTENFNRPKRELEYIMKVFHREIGALLKDPSVMKEGMRVMFIGRPYLFDIKLQKLMAELSEKTCKNKRFTMNFALGYGGRSEIVDATRRICEAVANGALDVKDIDEKTVMEHLYLSSEPDMVIRTGGEKRTSNFLIYQSAYSELFFLDKFWPEIEEDDVLDCIKEFRERERRFGK